jgi:hypothetical protein
MNISERNILPISAAGPKLKSVCLERGSLVFGTEVALITSSIRSATSARKRERSSLDSENKRAKISKASDQNRMGSKVINYEHIDDNISRVLDEDPSRNHEESSARFFEEDIRQDLSSQPEDSNSTNSTKLLETTV